MSEKIGGAKGSRLDEDFMELERVSCFLDSLMHLRLACSLRHFTGCSTKSKATN